MVAPYSDPDRVLTVLFFLKRGKSTAAHHRIRSSSEYTEDMEVLKLRKLDEEDYKVKIAPMLAFFLHQLMKRNDKVPASFNKTNNCTVFNAQVAPEISVEKYFERIIRYTPCSPECFLIAVLYIDQIIYKHNLLVTSLNVHRLIITSILIAAKLYDDTTYDNKYYAHVGGVPLREINSLELQFVQLLEYELNVDVELFNQYRNEAELQVVRDELLLLNMQAEELEAEDGDEEQDQDAAVPDNEFEDQAVEVRESKNFIQKRMRRSRSFQTVVSESSLFVWGKRRSISFNQMVASW